MIAPMAFLGLDNWWQWAALIGVIVLLIVWAAMRRRA